MLSGLSRPYKFVRWKIAFRGYYVYVFRSLGYTLTYTHGTTCGGYRLHVIESSTTY